MTKYIEFPGKDTEIPAVGKIPVQVADNYSLYVIGGTGPSNQTGSAGTNDNDVVYDSNNVSGLDLDVYNVHYIECTAGAVDVDVSINGGNWIAAVALRDIKSLTPSTFVASLDSSGAVFAGELRGCFERIRVNQSGATAANARIRHAVM